MVNRNQFREAEGAALGRVIGGKRGGRPGGGGGAGPPPLLPETDFYKNYNFILIKLKI